MVRHSGTRDRRTFVEYRLLPSSAAGHRCSDPCRTTKVSGAKNDSRGNGASGWLDVTSSVGSRVITPPPRFPRLHH